MTNHEIIAPLVYPIAAFATVFYHATMEGRRDGLFYHFATKNDDGRLARARAVLGTDEHSIYIAQRSVFGGLVAVILLYGMWGMWWWYGMTIAGLWCIYVCQHVETMYATRNDLNPVVYPDREESEPGSDGSARINLSRQTRRILWTSGGLLLAMPWFWYTFAFILP